MKDEKSDKENKTGIALLSAATAAFIYLGAAWDGNFYIAAVVSGLWLFRLATGSACPLVCVLSKLGADGRPCPTYLKNKAV